MRSASPVCRRLIHSCERQTRHTMFPRTGVRDSSHPTRGRLPIACDAVPVLRIHPFLRRADSPSSRIRRGQCDSSLLAKGRHSVFMRLLAALNTSLYNLHKCHSRFIHIFNMPKNPPHFHFFSNYFLFFQPPLPETFRLRMI